MCRLWVMTIAEYGLPNAKRITTGCPISKLRERHQKESLVASGAVCVGAKRGPHYPQLFTYIVMAAHTFTVQGYILDTNGDAAMISTTEAASASLTIRWNADGEGGGDVNREDGGHALVVEDGHHQGNICCIIDPAGDGNWVIAKSQRGDCYVTLNNKRLVSHRAASIVDGMNIDVWSLDESIHYASMIANCN
jgi:hypothetical protein